MSAHDLTHLIRLARSRGDIAESARLERILERSDRR